MTKFKMNKWGQLIETDNTDDDSGYSVRPFFLGLIWFVVVLVCVVGFVEYFKK